MRIPPLYLCPDCEGHGTIMYAGRVVFKRCSSCEDGLKNARTGADRQRDMRPRSLAPWRGFAAPGIDPTVREVFGKPSPALVEFMEARRRGQT